MALMDKKREESLFWAYELYHSGFKDEVWQFVTELYLQHYATYNPRFRTRLELFYTEWQKTNDSCLLGTVVGTLACWDCEKDILNSKLLRRFSGESSNSYARHFVTASLRNSPKQQPVKKFLILYKEDRHQTIPVTYPARNYLQHVSKFSVRIPTLQNAELQLLLRQNWLYYCAKTPIWLSRIQEGRGFIQENTKTVEFNTDEDLEEFYDKWGFEPDEQSMEMHRIHGIYQCPLIS
jgi:hypothetical protein